MRSFLLVFLSSLGRSKIRFAQRVMTCEAGVCSCVFVIVRVSIRHVLPVETRLEAIATRLEAIVSRAGGGHRAWVEGHGHGQFFQEHKQRAEDEVHGLIESINQQVAEMQDRMKGLQRLQPWFRGVASAKLPFF